MVDFEVDDLLDEKSSPPKTIPHTIACDAKLKALFKTASEKLGEKNAAEVIRRAARAGIEKALEKKRDRSA